MTTIEERVWGILDKFPVKLEGEEYDRAKVSIERNLSELEKEAEQRGIQRCVDVVNEIKNNSGEDSSIQWFDALHCVRHTLSSLQDNKCQHNNSGQTCHDCKILVENSATQKYPVTLQDNNKDHE